jgi:hypothetical protein
MHTKFYSETATLRDHLGIPRRRWEEKIKIDLKQDVPMRIGFNWFKIGNAIMILLVP